jgi:hypothetical protein
MSEPHLLGCGCGCDADGFTDGSRAGSPMEAAEYVPAVIPPDRARDARVAARRAEDARRAGAALDQMFGPAGAGRAYNLGWSDGYAASQLHHNRHYGVPAERRCCAAPEECRDGCKGRFLDPWADAWPDGAV